MVGYGGKDLQKKKVLERSVTKRNKKKKKKKKDTLGL